jgi:uncharacterized protein DUF4160
VPTLLRVSGFEVIIYFNDHEPAHVHVFKGSGEARIEIDPAVVVEVWRLGKRDTKSAKEIVINNRQLLLDRWKDIHG